MEAPPAACCWLNLEAAAPVNPSLIDSSREDASWLEEGSAEEARERFGVPVTHLVV